MNPAEILAKLDGAKPQADGSWFTLCPAHDDQHTPNLHISVSGDRILVNCLAGCRQPDVLAALARRGIKPADLFLNGNRPGRPPEPAPQPSASGPRPATGPASQHPPKPPLTLATFAKAKCFTVDFLRGHGWAQDHDVLTARYLDRDSKPTGRVRIRRALAAKDGSSWSGAGLIIPYGSWRLDQAHDKGELLLVEGETDTLTAWLSNIPALGIPGANMVKVLKAEDLAGIEKVYVLREPDRGGHAFVPSVRVGRGSLPGVKLGVPAR